MKNYLNERNKIFNYPRLKKIISNAVFGFIDELTRKENNICCCP